MRQKILLALIFFPLLLKGQIAIDSSLSITTSPRVNIAATGSWVVADGPNTYTINVPKVKLKVRCTYAFTFTNGNTTSSTLAFNSSSTGTPSTITYTFKKRDSGGSLVNLASGDIVAGGTYRFTNDGTYLIMAGGGGSGTVTSVSGTANQIASTGGTTPVLSIVTNPILPGAPTIVSPGNSTNNIITTNATQTLSNKTLVAPALGTIASGDGAALTNVVNSVTGDGVGGTSDNPVIDITSARTLTTSGAVVQSDNLHVIYLNSATPFNLTLDALTTNTQISLINKGSATVTLVPGTSVTITGNTSILANGSAGIIYETGTTPRVISGGGITPSTATTGDIIYASATNTYSNLADVATGNVLISGGVATAPSYGKVTSSHVDETVYKAGGNNAVGPSVLGLTSAQQLTIQTGNANLFFDTNSLRRFTLKSDGLAFIGADGTGNYSSSTEKFVINFNGMSTGSTTNWFSGKSNTTTYFRLTTDGRAIFGSNTAGSCGIWTGTSNSASVSPTSTDQHGLVYSASTGATIGTLHYFRNASNQSNTSGDGYGLRTAFNWDPASGTGNFSQLSFEGQINQTSTASGAYSLITDKNLSKISSTGGLYGITLATAGLKNGLGTLTPVSTLEVVGSFGSTITTLTTTTTLNDTHSTILVDATSGAVTINLPAASGSTRRIYTIKKIDVSANAVTIDGNSSETIDGATTQTLSTQYQFMKMQTNGTAWFITGQ